MLPSQNTICTENKRADDVVSHLAQKRKFIQVQNIESLGYGFHTEKKEDFFLPQLALKNTVLERPVLASFCKQLCQVIF